MRGGASSSVLEPSAVIRKPQSMQAMAPSLRTEPQAGHLAGPAAAAGFAGAGFAGAGFGGAGGRRISGLDGGRAAPTVAGAREGTVNGFVHEGHFTVFPATLSGTCIGLVQCGQRITT